MIKKEITMTESHTFEESKIIEVRVYFMGILIYHLKTKEI